MPAQVYSCPRHKEFDVSVPFSQDVPQTAECPEKPHGRACCEIAKHVLKAPSGILIKSTWNDNANEMRRDPYTQAKYQAQHMRDEQRDQGNLNLPEVTEEGLQVVAARIDKENKKGGKPESDGQKAVRAMKKARGKKA